MSKLLVLGGGGHAKVVIDAASRMGLWNKIAVLDDSMKSGSMVMGCRVIGRMADFASFREEFDQAIVAIGNNNARLEYLDRLEREGFSLATIFHPSAMVSDTARIGRGSVLIAGAIVNADAEIGIGCIINTGATVDHDCSISDGVHVCPGAHLAGSVSVGRLAWVGIGAAVIQEVSIGSDAVIAAGGVVIDDVEPGAKMGGVPARRIGIRIAKK